MTMRRFRRQRRRPAATTDRRSPELRLEAMAREKNDERRRRMLDRLLDDLATGSSVLEWMAATSTLRDRVVIGEDETYHLALLLAEESIYGNEIVDPELVRLGAEIDAIEEAHGLRANETFVEEDAPAEWLDLTGAWRARTDAMIATLMREGGLADVAQVFAQQRGKFDERATEGSRRLWGSDEDEAGYDLA